MGKSIFVIMFVLFTIFLGFGIIIPILPEVVIGVGAKFHNAMLLSVYSAASFLMSPVWGALSDRFGRRPIILIGLIGFSVSFLLFGLAFDQLWLMYVARILGGLFSGAATACAVAYVSDITDEKNRTQGMGFVGMSIGLGFIFGPAIGGLLSHFSLQIPFFIATGTSLLAFLFAYFILKESLPIHLRSKHHVKNTSRWSAFSGSLKFLYIVSFLVSFTLAGLEATLQYFQMIRIQATPVDIGWMFMISGIVGAIIQGGVVRKMASKGAELRVIGLGLFLSAIGFALLLLSSNIWTASFYLSIFAAGNALVRPCVTSLITKKTTVGQGVATGLNSSMDSLGRIIGPLIGGSLFMINPHWPFLFGSLICILAILMLIRFVNFERYTQ
jgi:DHA1 family multidrug resistance protein-like MFS transporter